MNQHIADMQAAFRKLDEQIGSQPLYIFCNPTAHRLMREYVEYPPRMRAYRAISRGTDPVAARYAQQRIRELRASLLT